MLLFSIFPPVTSSHMNLDISKFSIYLPVLIHSVGAANYTYLICYFSFCLDVSQNLKIEDAQPYVPQTVFVLAFSVTGVSCMLTAEI